MKQNKHIIASVKTDSIAEEMGLEPGDILISINGTVVKDIFDFHYLVNDEYLEVLVKKPEGEEWELEIEKEYDEDLGITFTNGLMDNYRSCTNGCVFCFIDQMPKGMRDTLYFKDDDSRLSFLQGNYVTLTNMKDADIERIIQYNLSPINISFHTTNSKLRAKMLKNRFAGDALRKVDRLYEAGIEMNGQIVLCKGMNDGAELEKSIYDLQKYIPYLRSVSVVPVGLTKFRDGLTMLESFGKEDAKQVLEIIHKWQNKIYKEHGFHFVHPGDEWYILAEEKIPHSNRYDGYVQLENGVGMIRLLSDEIKDVLKDIKGDDRECVVSLATGVSAFAFMKKYIEQIQEKFPKVKVHLYQIKNNFFGEKITVAGLLTGTDLIAQLKGQELGERLLLSHNVLRAGEEVLLDDISIQEIKKALQVQIHIVESSGAAFVNAVIEGEKK
jgi:Fe-S oxidoreductase, related to NifB/MoaA family